MRDVAPPLRQAIEAFAGDRTHGAAWLAREAADVMARAAREIPAQTPPQMVSNLREVAQALTAAQPRLKVAPARWEETGEALPLDASPEEPPALYFDATPPRLITALITEEGVFKPRRLAPLARRARRWQRVLSR